MPNRRAIAFCLALLAALLWVAPARAGITLTLTVRATLSNGVLTARVSVANKGGEAAHGLSYSAFLGQETAGAQGASLLSPGASDHRELKLPFSPPRDGGYGLGVRVDYHDARGYPLSAVSWGLFAKGRLVIAPRLLRGKPGNPWPGRPPAYVLVNPLDSPLDVRLEVFAPAEFKPSHLVRTIHLTPGGKRVVPLELDNRAALAGSTYAIAGLASYVHQGVHHIAAAQTLLSVRLLSDPFYAWRPWLWALAGLLLAAMLALAWYRRRRAA